jgi:hypothetical protein
MRLKSNNNGPSKQNFQFLKSIRLYISTDANDEIELAYKDDINSTSNTLTLTPTERN